MGRNRKSTRAMLLTPSVISFSQKPVTDGVIAPQGPMRIDMTRMSPKEIASIIELYVQNNQNKSEQELYHALFKSLQHPSNPSKQEITRMYNGRAKITRPNAYYSAYADLIFGMLDNSQRVRPDNPINILEIDTGNNQYMYNQNVIMYNDDANDSTIVHEMIHALQSSFPQMYQIPGLWAANRIKGEKPIPVAGVSAAIAQYRDRVDNPYTLAQYTRAESDAVKSDNYFLEVLATAFENIKSINQRKDKELLMLAIKTIQVTNGYYK